MYGEFLSIPTRCRCYRLIDVSLRGSSQTAVAIRAPSETHGHGKGNYLYPPTALFRYLRLKAKTGWHRGISILREKPRELTPMLLAASYASPAGRSCWCYRLIDVSLRGSSQTAVAIRAPSDTHGHGKGNYLYPPATLFRYLRPKAKTGWHRGISILRE